jgi:hypothetical protein
MRGKIFIYIQKRTRGTNAAITNPKSIMESRRKNSVSGRRKSRIYNALVARANHRCWAFLLIPGSSDCSDAETDPQGYSAPTPIPIKKLNNLREQLCKTRRTRLTASHSTYSTIHLHSHVHQMMPQIAGRTGRLCQ